MSANVIVVASALQKAMLEKVLIPQIEGGFWKDSRPAGHADSFKGITVKVVKAAGDSIGPQGMFELARMYNFVNPDFLKTNLKALMATCTEIKADITERAVKKELIELNQILGGRIKAHGEVAVKLKRGRTAGDATGAATKAKADAKPKVKKVAVTKAKADAKPAAKPKAAVSKKSAAAKAKPAAPSAPAATEGAAPAAPAA